MVQLEQKSWGLAGSCASTRIVTSCSLDTLFMNKSEQEYKYPSIPMKLVFAEVFNFDKDNQQISLKAGYEDSGTMYTYAQDVSIAGCHSYNEIRAAVNSVIIANAPSTITESDILFPLLIPPVTIPTSYQTIVSQTSTGAPAVAGGFSPVSTYASGVTFAWARTSAGVYTITASAAVFNTSGKTSVFMTPPQNLNGSFRAVVTSTTVITITTAVQSLAVLGLLGFTATNTDGLLNGTMIYVQTYA